jgi:hypothetical protein
MATDSAAAPTAAPTDAAESDASRITAYDIYTYIHMHMHIDIDIQTYVDIDLCLYIGLYIRVQRRAVPSVHRRLQRRSRTSPGTHGYSRVLTGTQHRCDGAATFPYLKSVVMELDVHSLVFCSAPTAAAVRPPVSTLVPPTAAAVRPLVSTLVPPTAAVRPLVSTLVPLPRRRSPCRKSATVERQTA